MRCCVVSRSYVTRLFEIDTDLKNVFTLKSQVFWHWSLLVLNLSRVVTNVSKFRNENLRSRESDGYLLGTRLLSVPSSYSDSVYIFLHSLVALFHYFWFRLLDLPCFYSDGVYIFMHLLILLVYYFLYWF